ncbi:GAF domain-containing protein [Marmoricola sp. RAF53]|uniref:GAF domain-containing protein n=1 Tax=Marmoricola sp. RAF53 TaxID=3233059 RepID=UPI003F95C878
MTAPRALLDAVTALSGTLDVRRVLTRLVSSATALTDARHGTLTVVGADGVPTEMVTSGTPTAPGGPALGVPVRIRGRVFGHLSLCGRPGDEPFTAEDRSLVEALANAAALVLENARSYELGERRRRWLEASALLTDDLQPPIDTGDALHAVAVRARGASGAATTAVVQVPVDRPPAVRAVAGGAGADLVPTLHGVVSEASAAVLPADGPDATTYAVEVDLGGRSALVVPLRAHLVPDTVLVVLHDRPAPAVEHEDRDLLATYADRAGLTLDRAQAVADREELAVVEERERIARDLHDVVIQRLFATGLTLEGARTSTDPAASEALLATCVAELDRTITDIRSTIFDLRRGAVARAVAT